MPELQTQRGASMTVLLVAFGILVCFVILKGISDAPCRRESTPHVEPLLPPAVRYWGAQANLAKCQCCRCSLPVPYCCLRGLGGCTRKHMCQEFNNWLRSDNLYTVKPEDSIDERCYACAPYDCYTCAARLKCNMFTQQQNTQQQPTQEKV